MSRAGKLGGGRTVNNSAGTNGTSAPPPPPSGLILPPTELKAVIDRTADFVNRNGPVFETQLMQRQGGTKRFQFLNPDNPFNTYYKYRLALEGTLLRVLLFNIFAGVLW